MTKSCGPGKALLYIECAKAGMTRRETQEKLNVHKSAVQHFCLRNPEIKFAKATLLRTYGLTKEQLKDYKLFRRKHFSKADSIRMAKENKKGDS
jgi:hypothetical protein